MIQSTSRLIVCAAILVVGLAVSLVCAQDPAQVGPTIYKLLFENERVRVFEVRFKPGEKIALHAHPDHVVYVFGDGKLRLSYPDGKAVEVGLKAGQTLWIPAETHAAESVGSTDAHAQRSFDGIAGEVDYA
jgi:quercetin dioxygenase-like cupin family protein